MDIFGFVSWCLVTVCAVTLLWPVNVPLAALAYKVRQGAQPVDMEAGEFWWRCTFASLGLAGLSLALLGLLYALITLAQLPTGPAQLTLFLLYLPAAVGYCFWIFGLDDVLQAAGIFVLYVLLPGLPLLLVGRLAHLWDTLRQSAPWLLSPT